MPAFDKSGPNGQGPMTGRRMGACSGSNYPGNEAPFHRGRGLGRGNRGGYAHTRGEGFGYHRGFRNRYFENTPETSDKTFLENEINTLRNQLDYYEKKLSEVKGD
ncbi:MAG: DUF5320 domain-containing protein [Bacteroidota bacterium]